MYCSEWISGRAAYCFNLMLQYIAILMFWKKDLTWSHLVETFQIFLRVSKLLLCCLAFHEIVKGFMNIMIITTFWPLQAWGQHDISVLLSLIIGKLVPCFIGWTWKSLFLKIHILGWLLSKKNHNRKRIVFILLKHFMIL